MKSIIGILILIGLCAVAYSYDINSVYKTTTYVSGSTSSSVELSSTTINFYVTDFSFACAGDYAVIKTSFSSTASDNIYVSPTVYFSSPKFETPLKFPGTTNKFVLNLQPATTVYYYIGGVK
jgi:hypothetical protein